jgi:SAM-dependent methyltransferase
VGAGVEGKWAGTRAAEHYARGRFRSTRAAARDPRLVAALLRRHHAPAAGLLLDAPCGAGRLGRALATSGRAVGLDANRPMLEAARDEAGLTRLVEGSVMALPFAEAAFDVVVCCRLLHHLRERAELERAVRELVRVSRRLVVVSFWDAASWPALRVRLGLKRSEGTRGRVAAPRAELAALFAAAGAPVVEFRAVLRFVSQQTFLVAERTERAP